MTTEADYKALIILQIGDDASGTLAANIDLLWDTHADIANPALVALLTKRDAINVMLARVRNQVNFQALDGARVAASDMFSHLLAMRKALEEQIAQAMAGQDGSVAIGQLTTTAPIERDMSNQPDPNNRIYRGDPLRRRGRRIL